MKNVLTQTIAVASMLMLASLAQAESFVADEDRSYENASQRKLIASCMDVIEDHYVSDVKLALNRRGVMRTDDVSRTFSIRGWIWQDGERVQVVHDCEARSGTDGLLVQVEYPFEAKLAAADNEAVKQ